MLARRPVPLIGDASSAADRATTPDAWRFPAADRTALTEVIAARRDVRRFRPDAVPEDVLERVLTAAHRAPSVGHSQPWRFLVLDDPAVRDRAAVLADRERLAQAAQLDPDAARRLLDLQLEGIREAPLGIVVCCDRRTPAAGVLGRATFPDADMWSCACAIQNLWLAARAEGLGLGWVTLFRPDELAALLGLPEGVVTLGWLCLGWPDERPPEPGLERAGWSRRQPLSEVVVRGRWPSEDGAPGAPASHLRAPTSHSVVRVRDEADRLLTTPGSLGVLDRAVDRFLAAGGRATAPGSLVLAVGRHRVTERGVSAYPDSVVEEVLLASRNGTSMAAVAAGRAGLELVTVDGGRAQGDLVVQDALDAAAVEMLIGLGQGIGARAGRAGCAGGIVALGEVGVGNTTVAALLTAACLALPADEVVGLGAGADSAMLERKRDVITRSLARVRPGPGMSPQQLLAALGGPEFALLTGVVLGATTAGGVVVLDGLATTVSALLAVQIEPVVAGYLVAGQRSRERGHALVLNELGLEPLLDLRLRAGEGVGAALAVGLLRDGLFMREQVTRTAPVPDISQRPDQ